MASQMLFSYMFWILTVTELKFIALTIKLLTQIMSQLNGTLKDPQRQTLWGAPAPKSWFERVVTL